MENNIKIEAYHGTDAVKKDSILKMKTIYKSSKDNEWAGEGIYYFVDEAEQDLINKCVLWAKNVKKYETPAVIKNTIVIDKNRILDLSIEENQKKFHEYRQVLFDRANQCAKKANKRLSCKYTNFRKLDCLTINQLCERFDLHLVKRKAYINFYRALADWEKYPITDIPNATMISLRKEGYIKEWRECDVK